ncbi:MAG: CRISP-associated protein Cas1 [bacterium]|nr:MAG: CRISP-associated protein Cas1 [bacterium]
MAILYVTQQGANIRHISGRIIVRREDRIIEEIPDFKVEQIVIFGNVQLTPSTMTYCFEQGVDVAFLSSTGKYRGRLENRLAKNALLRQRQHEGVKDPNFYMKNASVIVVGKIRSMIAMIQRQRRLRPDGSSPISELESLLPKVTMANNLDSLNGLEGIASAAYFRAFRAALKGDWGFEARKYRPATDPVNSLLSFGYTLLHNDVFAAINMVGLDPYAGVFHRPHLGHATLASDLIEEHRSVVVDRLVLTALNKRVIVETDFVLNADKQLRLASEALKRFLQLYATQLNETLFYPPQKINTTYRKVIELQVRHFARVVLGEDAIYQPFFLNETQIQDKES